ncbi:MAG: DUF2461 domain-containing protein [Clostridiales bacterium]|jgi:uncharacterized protein (TIGR02453 family)|nr:DUF2461 domain-containing protein [Clostridiales bacterium]
MKNMFKFLSQWEANNNREWLLENKELFMLGYHEFEIIANTMMRRIENFDPESLDRLSMEKVVVLDSDPRFDGSPKRAQYLAEVIPHGKVLGYFISVSPGNRSFIGGGLFPTNLMVATKLIRDYIDVNGKELEAILQNPKFAATYELKGVNLKYVPRDYRMKHPYSAYLKHKSWFVDFQVSDSLVMSPSFPGIMENACSTMKPFLDYLNLALDGYEKPKK